MSGNMAFTFAALRFAEDENVCNRVYWYLTDFAVQEGQRVLAPLGAHDKLQAAVVERTLVCGEADAPYDVRLAKKIVAPAGARRIRLKGVQTCRDLGGLRYDGKHFTRYGVFVYAEGIPADGDSERLSQYGVRQFFRAEAAESFVQYAESEQFQSTLGALALAEGCALICGDAAAVQTLCVFLLLLAGVGKEAVAAEYPDPAQREKLQLFLRQIEARGGAAQMLCDVGLSRETIARLREKLQ